MLKVTSPLEARELQVVEPTADTYAALRLVGAGDPWRRVRDGEHRAAHLAAGDVVHVLLDDGRVVETTLRAPPGDRHLAFLDGFDAAYAHSRVRPVGGWDE